MNNQNNPRQSNQDSTSLPQIHLSINPQSQQETPSCHHLNSTKVARKQRHVEIETNYAIIHRARKCSDCGKVFFTIEDIEYDADTDDKVSRRVVSAFYLDLLGRGAKGNVIPWGWPFDFRASTLVRHLQQYLVPNEILKVSLANKNRQISHITPISEFGYPLPHEDGFHVAWSLKNTILR